jgi:hypothetical protein
MELRYFRPVIRQRFAVQEAGMDEDWEAAAHKRIGASLREHFQGINDELPRVIVLSLDRLRKIDARINE